MKRKLRHYAILDNGACVKAVRWSRSKLWHCTRCRVFRASTLLGNWTDVYKGTIAGRTEVEAVHNYSMVKGRVVHVKA